MARELESKVALVTGAGTGIGAAIATTFAGAGATVILTGRRAALLEATASRIASDGTVEVHAADMADEQSVHRVVEDVVSRHGHLDVVVNNAAVAGEVGNIWELSLDGWQEALTINLTGPWLCTRAAAPHMMAQRSGTIVNIGSISGKRPLATRTPYTATKMGLVGLTKTCALELGEHGIRVNLISPGAVDTPRLEELAQKWNRSLDEMRATVAEQAALKRISTSADIAEAALFLASGRSHNITGVDLTVDGGVSFQ